jgi:fructose-bisphosphate aldolase class II
MNIDTDLQFAFTEGVRDYMVKNIDYLKTQIEILMVQIFQIKTHDPRKWLRESNHFLRLEQAHLTDDRIDL